MELIWWAPQWPCLLAIDIYNCRFADRRIVPGLQSVAAAEDLQRLPFAKIEKNGVSAGQEIRGQIKGLFVGCRAGKIVRGVIIRPRMKLLHIGREILSEHDSPVRAKI